MKYKYNKIFIFIWPVVAPFIAILVHANFFSSIFIFFGFPAIYLSILSTQCVKKAALFALVTTPFTIVIDYIMETTGGWFIPYSIFDPFRLFGYVTIDILVWFFLYVFVMVMYYETFLDHHVKIQTQSKRLKYLILILLGAFIVFILIYFSRSEILNIDYFYLKAGAFFVITPIITILAKFPKLFAKLFKAGAYFFCLTLSYEITALALEVWTFPGKNQFIGFVNLMGYEFPIEEFFFWVMLFSIALLSYYEFWDDDRK